ncbi:MAG: hypothetical protein V1827_05990 [Candidatus Micrarchaeota archaeon]
MATDLLTILNFVLCLAIAVVGYAAYRRDKNVVPLYIGLAFFVFSLSHLITIAGMGEELSGVLIVMRILAYITVLYAVYRRFDVKKKK